MEIDTNPHHPIPHHSTNPLHRKIELQSPADLAYLQSNLAASAQQKLDLHFPLQYSALRDPRNAKPTVITLDGTAQQQQEPEQATQEEDPMRLRVRGLVDEFLSRTWSGVGANATVNGRDASLHQEQHQPAESDQNNSKEREGIDFTYTPFDARLQEKVASLYAELEALTAQVSRLRREAPRKGAEAFSNHLQAELAADEQDWITQSTDLQPTHHNQNILQLDNVPRQGWNRDVGDLYRRGVEDLARLGGFASSNSIHGNADRLQLGVATNGGGSLTETVGKVQRARTVAMEFE